MLVRPNPNVPLTLTLTLTLTLPLSSRGKDKATCNHKQCHTMQAPHLRVKEYFLNGSQSQSVGGKYGGEMQAAVAAATASMVAGARLELEHNYNFTCEGAYTKAMYKGPTLFITVPPAADEIVCLAQPCSLLIRRK